jgi:two-component system, NarL family, response regulator NreC
MQEMLNDVLTVAVVDDHAVVRAGVRLILGAEPDVEVVAEGSDLASALELVKALRPAVLLLDLNLPDGSGLEALPAISAESPRTKVIVLTMQEGPGFADEALAAGAWGYLLKEAADGELVGALRTVLSGRKYLDPRVGATMSSGVGAGPGGSPLNERELAVVRLLARGYTNAQVADALHFSERTIEYCRSRVRLKLGIRDRAGLTEYARAEGLL